MSDATRISRADSLERGAATVAVIAAGMWIGGLFALGACAAPFVFRLTPAPFSGDAMGSAFARFDQIAIGAAVVILACELVRTWVARRRPRTIAPRLRRVAALVMAGCAAYTGLVVTPRILELHRAGAQRNIGPEGADLERVHARAEAIGKAELGLGIALIALHVFTLARWRRDDDDDDDVAATPGAPGPADA
jgi:hypothetical protein